MVDMQKILRESKNSQKVRTAFMKDIEKKKAATKHPYAATEHRVIDSEAYADLTFSARSLLVIFTPLS